MDMHRSRQWHPRAALTASDHSSKNGDRKRSSGIGWREALAQSRNRPRRARMRMIAGVIDAIFRNRAKSRISAPRASPPIQPRCGYWRWGRSKSRLADSATHGSWRPCKDLRLCPVARSCSPSVDPCFAVPRAVRRPGVVCVATVCLDGPPRYHVFKSSRARQRK